VKYLLDTDTLSNLLRPAPHPALLRQLALTPNLDQVTTSITLSELLYGARRLGTAGNALYERIEALIYPNLRVLPFDAAAAPVYAEIRATLERSGSPIGDADMRIAAIATIHGLTVVTGNVRHFQRIPGLSVENWLA